MNINGDIVSVSGGASYAVYSSLPSSSQTNNVGVGITEATPPVDTVEISAEGQAASWGTHSLGTFWDRFRYDIDNGLLSARRPVYAGAATPGSAAAATYSVRGQTRSLVSGGGLAGVQGAIFSLRYGDEAPNGVTSGIANRQAINAFKRIADQNLPLLSMVG